MHIGRGGDKKGSSIKWKWSKYLKCKGMEGKADLRLGVWLGHERSGKLRLEYVRFGLVRVGF